LGYFLRGTTQTVGARTVNAIARFITGILCAAYEKSVAAIQDAVADAPTASAMRQFLNSGTLTPKLCELLDAKTRHALRRALQEPRNRRGPIVFAIDSTCKSTLAQFGKNLFSVGRWGKAQARNHIYVCGVLLFPDGRCLPVRPRQKKKGRWEASQIDLAGELVQQLVPWLGRYEVVVVADAFFFSRKLIDVLQASPFHYVLACRGNTVVKGGRSLASRFARTRLTRSRATLPGSWGKRLQTYSAAREVLDLRSGGTQAALVSRLHRKRRATTKYLVSDLVDAPLTHVLGLYSVRWAVEVYFRDVKMFLGFDQYQVSSEHGPENFILLVTLAYQFLHWRGEAVQEPLGTVARLRRLHRILNAENVRIIERAVLTRHDRRDLRIYFGESPGAGAQRSRIPQNARSAPQ